MSLLKTDNIGEEHSPAPLDVVRHLLHQRAVHPIPKPGSIGWHLGLLAVLGMVLLCSLSVIQTRRFTGEHAV